MCFVIILYQPRLVEGLLQVVWICFALIAPCSVKIVLVAFLSFFFSLFPPYFITAGELPRKPLYCSTRSQQIECYLLLKQGLEKANPRIRTGQSRNMFHCHWFDHHIVSKFHGSLCMRSSFTLLVTALTLHRQRNIGSRC
jgi:hypothetical protein